MRTTLAAATVALALGASWGSWRPMTADELRAAIPERAEVDGERIETELRTASGLRDDAGRVVASVVLITAGYAANGKYSHWLVTQATLEMGPLKLAPGEYAFGYSAGGGDALQVSFYEAKTGRLVGAATARRESTKGPIRSVGLLPAADGRHGLQIGRFVAQFAVVD